ncbi:MAG: Preprotein translocase, SecG subunit [Candidatus Gottesmanbacteria bacterium GW2011_GWB1_43_11]|uniref:Protein-export membrane protein SecG n=1 Tax=Candidatus Gottesmanbacteria bacterium GW2011_GWB1_43_11 TaxID=1618446 RepID=A0A0G1CNK6_9BACT|nr:MAG: Preprotein translocase, SecG subunit [Candidatus Gottesmanbacteria bacterium GW2011_GWA2_42_16]KKS55633.1 MAG: Preprotein translocase, SecG subunit [Candidatus Gottesmanbacteria bacterium GW2011_GWA1_42_26]KKS82226.1 MAG: Preprotein translocase, SecG subunit [Candidatus Gottesmanbacteria bacterium GW2011_GWC1_43_10]KKS87124.1 MAG: Preprotein translocase, SecG subunit [Candidatus Gottesmanbacteria bacterium GW2011_GWB1_43_11]OGG07616.1 MAG: preprotein translocase subunit SecG [Candidatus
MKDVILVVQTLVSVGLIVSILLQAQGTGLGRTFGDSAHEYRSKRGVEKLLYRVTIILTALFLVTSVVNLLVK